MTSYGISSCGMPSCGPKCGISFYNSEEKLGLARAISMIKTLRDLTNTEKVYYRGLSGILKRAIT